MLANSTTFINLMIMICDITLGDSSSPFKKSRLEGSPGEKEVIKNREMGYI